MNKRAILMNKRAILSNIRKESDRVKNTISSKCATIENRGGILQHVLCGRLYGHDVLFLYFKSPVNSQDELIGNILNFFLKNNHLILG